MLRDERLAYPDCPAADDQDWTPDSAPGDDDVMCTHCSDLQQQCNAFRAAIHDRDIVIDALMHDDTLRARAQRHTLTIVEKPLSCAFCDAPIAGPTHVEVLLREGDGTLAPGMHPVCEACHVEFVRTQAGGWRR